MNHGDVSLDVDFSETDATTGRPDSPSRMRQEDCVFVVPEPMKVGPGRSVKCMFAITAKVVGHFNSNIVIKTKENTFLVPISGLGVKIKLTKRNKEILESERLPLVRF